MAPLVLTKNNNNPQQQLLQQNQQPQRRTWIAGTKRLQLILLAAVVVLLVSARTCQGLQPQKQPSSNNKFQNPFASSKQPAAPAPNFLETLKLESSTEPKTFGFLPNQILDLATAAAPFAFRLGSGVFAQGYQVALGARDDSRYTVLAFGDAQVREYSAIKSSKQNLPIVLYEFEGCPFCRKVREAVSILSLEVTFKPCPQGSAFRKEVKTKYPSSTFPYMVDPNTGVEMFESDDIIAYLFKLYGSPKYAGAVPWTLAPSNPLVALTAGLAMLPRVNRGGRYRASNPPETPLIFWSYEGSPFCKIVRERLVELGIPHTQISCPRGSYNRDRLFEKKGKFQAPYLEDPNHEGVELFESAAIIEYLEKVYGLVEPTVKYI